MADVTFPKGRYGRRRHTGRSRYTAWIRHAFLAVIIVMSTFLAWSMYNAYEKGSIDSRVTAFSIHSDTSITVEFSVTLRDKESVACTVRARGRDGGEVGRDTVTVRSTADDLADGSETKSASTTLTTTERAVTGEILRCE